MKKVVLLFFMLLFVFMFFSNFVLANDTMYDGLALVNLPEKEVYKNQTELKAFLKVKNVSIDQKNNNFALDAEIKFGNKNYSIQLGGKMFQSHKSRNDILFNLTNLNIASNLEVVLAKLYQNPKYSDLKVNKNLKGNKTFVLYLFDKQNRNLFGFEVSAEELALQNLNGLDFPLRPEINDFWVYKVMVGEINETQTYSSSNSILSGTNNEAITNISQAITYINPWGDGCDETHSKYARLSIVGSTILTDGDYVYANLEVTGQGIMEKCGNNYQYYPDVESAVWFGSYGDPVQIKTEFSGDYERDFIKITKWWGVYDKNPINLKASLTVGYGPLSITPVEYELDYLISPETNQTVYTGGGDYSFEKNYSFSDTRLFSPGQIYTSLTTLGVEHQLTSNKYATARVIIPVYGNYDGYRKYRDANYTATITYKNR